MSEKKLRRRCVECSQVFDVIASKGNEMLYMSGHCSVGSIPENMVMWQTHPFNEEVHGEREKMWMCLDCAYDRYLDT